MASKKENGTVLDFINLSDIRGSFLYTKDGYLFSYLSVSPISTALLTEHEKQQLTDHLTRELSPFRTPFRFLILSRPTDVRQIVDYYERVKEATEHTKKRENLTKSIRFFSALSNSGKVLEFKTYLELWQKQSDHAADELASRVSDFRNAMLNCGVKAAVCREQEIIEMVNLFYHPLQNGNETLNVTPAFTFWQSKEADGS